MRREVAQGEIKMQEFIGYWDAHREQQDDGKILYDKHQRALIRAGDNGFN